MEIPRERDNAATQEKLQEVVGYDCEDVDENKSCPDCAFLGGDCDHIACLPIERADKRNIIFVKQTTEPVEDLFALKNEIARLREQAELLLQAKRACTELPEGYAIRIELERGSGWIKLYDAEGDPIEVTGGHESLARDLSEAIDLALAGKEPADD